MKSEAEGWGNNSKSWNSPPDCWRYAQEAIIKVVIIYLYVYDKCLYTML
jgi:hypothetical protein